MKMRQFIRECCKLLREHGDLEVETGDVGGYRVTHRGPDVAYRRVLVGREHKTAFAYSYDPDERRGEKVFRV